MPVSVLICGDGNFSFSLAVAKLIKSGEPELIEELLGQYGPFEILCTSFDTRPQLLKKYKECEHILPMLDDMGRAGISVQHGINAWELEHHFPERKFDVVLWNHPHLGTENFNLHRFLLCHFMHSAQKVLRPQGCIVLSVLKGQSQRWAIDEQGAKVGLRLSRLMDFLPEKYPGYETRRNRTGSSFQNTHTQHHTGDALTSVSLRFQRAAEAEGEGGAEVAAPAAPEPHTIKKKPAENKFFCKICGKGFKKAQGVFTHTKQVHDYKKYGEDWQVEGKGLKCRSCDKTFPNEDALWQHEIATHTDDAGIPHPSRDGDVLLEPEEPSAKEYGYYPCEVCGMSVSRHPDWGMEAHLESLKPIVGLELPCGLKGCSKVFIEQRAMRQHRNFCRIRVRQEEERAAAGPGMRSLLCLGGATALAAVALVTAYRRRA